MSKGTRRDATRVVVDSFDGLARSYQEGRSTDAAFQGEWARIKSLLVQAPGPLLEIGCGVGLASLELAGEGRAVVATDLSMEMLRLARINATESPEGVGLVGLVRCDVERLPFRDGSFRAALCHGVLEYVPDVSRALEESFRILGQGGSLIAAMPNRLAPASWIGSALRVTLRILKGHRPGRHKQARHLRPGQWDAGALRAGFNRRERTLETFSPLPPDLFPRRWLRISNRIFGKLPAGVAFRWWATEYIVRYEKP